MSALIPGEQRQAILLDNDRLEDVDKSRLDVRRKRPGHRGEAGLILLVPHSLTCNPAFGGGVKYSCVQTALPTRQ